MFVFSVVKVGKCHLFNRSNHVSFTCPSNPKAISVELNVTFMYNLEELRRAAELNQNAVQIDSEITDFIVTSSDQNADQIPKPIMRDTMAITANDQVQNTGEPSEIRNLYCDITFRF